MNTKDYTLTDYPDELLASVCEKFYQGKENLVGNLISWEEITTNYLNLELPDSELERRYWVSLRSNWIRKMNSSFIQFKYPVRFKVFHSKGVQLYSDNHAVNSAISQGMKKVSNAIRNYSELFDSMRVCYPEATKLLGSASKMMTETLYGITGRIDSSKLPESTKTNLKAIVQRCLPIEEE